MEKTYQLLDHKEPLPIAEIRKLYKGYWVYIVKADITDEGSIISGIPVVKGIMAHDGAEDGIYEKYNTDEWIKRTDLSLLPNRGFISCLNFMDGSNG